MLRILFCSDISADLSSPDIEGVYETHVPLMFRALINLGCVVTVDRKFSQQMAGRVRSVVQRNTLSFICFCRV